MKRSHFCFLSVATLLELTGCGGGSSAPSFGKATVTLQWPERTSRAIPRAANSIRLVVRDAAGAVRAEQIAVRPEAGGTSSVTFDPLPVGTLSVAATAHADGGGSGVALAVGSASLTVTAGANTDLGISLTSTIQSVQVVCASLPLRVTRTAALSLNARDTAGNLVLTSPDQWRFASSSELIARLLPPGDQLQAIATGNVTVTGTELESGVSGSLSVRTVPDAEFLSVSIPPFGPYRSVRAIAVNNLGWVAGYLSKNDTEHTPFVWKPRPDFSGGDYTELAALPGYDIVQPVSLSYDGRMLVSAYVNGAPSSDYWFWEGGIYTRHPDSVPYPVFLSPNGDLGGYNLAQPLILKRDGSSSLLPAGNYLTSSSDNNFVCGHTGGFGSGRAQAWRFKDGASSYVPPPVPFDDALAVAVRRSGEVCVHLYKSDSLGSVRGIGLWDGGPSLSVLPLLPDGQWALPVGMTEAGAVVGMIGMATGNVATIWRQGQPTALNSLIPPDGLKTQSIEQVSPRGFMTGNTNSGSTFVGILMFPTALF